MKINKIIIEGFHNVVRKEYNFQDLNYLFGSNGAGKSTVLQAIQLGLLGYVPGSNKTKQGVFAHSNNHTMAITLYLGETASVNDIVIQRVWNKVKTSVTETVNVTPDTYDINALIADVELPLFNFDEFTHMTANTLKDWFINYLPKNTFKTNWEEELVKAVKDLPDSAVDASLIDASVDSIKEFGLEGVEEVRQANTYFKNQLSFMKSELQRKISTIHSLIHYDDYVAVYSEEELKNKIRDTENAVVQASINKQNVERSVRLRKELESYGDVEFEYNSIIASRYAANDELVALEATIREKEKIFNELAANLRRYDVGVDPKGVCPYTKKSCEEITNLVETYRERQDQISAQMKSLDSEITELRNQKSEVETKLDNYKNKLYSIETYRRRIMQIRKELETLPTEVSIVDIELLQSELESYKDAYGKAVANRQYNELNDVIVGDKYRIENSIECLKLWVKLTDVNGLQTNNISENPFDKLTDNINDTVHLIFGKDTECRFILDGKSNSFSFGLVQKDTYVPYTMLSSGEKCLFILSMFIGLLNYTKSPLKLILIDDFLDHLDDNNFKIVFDVLKNHTDIQYVFAGVKPTLAENCNVVEITK